MNYFSYIMCFDLIEMIKNINKYYYKNKFNKMSISFIEFNKSMSDLLAEISNIYQTDEEWSWRCTHFRLLKNDEGASVGVQARNGEMKLFIKYFGRKEGNIQQSALREYENLRQVYNSLPSYQKYLVPKPLHSKSGAYAVEWLDIPRMKTSLMWARFNSFKRSSCLRSAARALKSIQESGACDYQQVDVSAYIRAAQRCGGTDPAWKHNLKHFQKASKRFEGRQIPYCRLHGDYSPENLLFSPERVVVIDFAHHDFASIYHDMCQFIMYFSLYCNNFIYNTKEVFIMDMMEFRSAYFDGKDDSNYDVFILMQWAALLVRWGRHDAKSKDLQRNFCMRILDRYFARQLKLCCLELQKLMASEPPVN